MWLSTNWVNSVTVHSHEEGGVIGKRNLLQERN